ncbi:MAG: tRNA threonylcarbamoyladenosine dehydratase [Tannerella sp.]|jgi:tRNA A37 threonylcarbamoyladenosine dehydratase|nr:tRNA threonylcarbamoyladenosine dehydratase [Tannerella sp.]
METNKKEDIFQRSELLLGAANMRRLADTRVILFGLGGVGSWCAEGLLRSGIGHLTLVDFDRVAASNINRQLPATGSSIGRMKAEVLRERLLDINPEAEVDTIEKAYTAESSASFALENYDYILDAIDSLPDKTHLIQTATRLPGVFFSSMGAALRMDNTRVRTAEFWKVQGCPLAAALRHRLKKSGLLPGKKFTCVFSDEPPMACEGRGSLVQVTATFGFTLAGLVVRDCCR